LRAQRWQGRGCAKRADGGEGAVARHNDGLGLGFRV
jgi:hypothetical protein